MSQIVPGQLVSGQVVQGQVVTAGQVVNSAGGQVVMNNNGIVGGQIVGDQLVVSHQQHLQQLQQANLVSNASHQNAGLQTQNVAGTAQMAQTQVVKMSPIPPPPSNITCDAPLPVISRSKLADLVREVDPNEQLDEEVEDVLLAIADDFIESSVTAACRLAKHRGSRTLDVRDLHMHLERSWHMWIPGFGTEELRPYKRAPTTEAHKQRMALIRKAVKKY